MKGYRLKACLLVVGFGALLRLGWEAPATYWDLSFRLAYWLGVVP